MNRLIAMLVLGLAAPAASAESPWTLGGGVVAFHAPALPSVVVGAGFDAARSLGGPWELTLRAAGGSASDANEFWDLQQTHLLTTVGASFVHPWDAGRLSLEADLGAMTIREDARRHQFERLTQANIEDRERIAWTVGPYAAIRLGVAVEFTDDWRFTLTAGPQFTFLQVNEAWTPSAGAIAGVGVRHAF